MAYPIFTQRDARWKDLKINGTDSSMDHYGCLVTSIAMLYSASDPQYTPDKTLTYLESLGAFVQDLVLWTKTPFFRSRFYCTDSLAPIDELKNELGQGHPILLNVHFGSGNPYKPNHWVLAIDSDFTIHDPWTGDVVSLAERYGPPAKAILGGAYFDTMPTVELAEPSEYPKKMTLEYRVNLRAESNKDSASLGVHNKGETITIVGEVEGQTLEEKDPSGVVIGQNNIWYNTGYGYIWSAGFKK